MKIVIRATQRVTYQQIVEVTKQELEELKSMSDDDYQVWITQRIDTRDVCSAEDLEDFDHWPHKPAKKGGVS